MDSDIHTDSENTMHRVRQSPALTHRHTHKIPKPIILSIPRYVHTYICAQRPRWLYSHTLEGALGKESLAQGSVRKWFWALAFIRVWNTTEQDL